MRFIYNLIKIFVTINILQQVVEKVEGLVPFPTAKISYVHNHSWKQLISSINNSSSNDKFTILYPTSFIRSNLSSSRPGSGSGLWIQEEESINGQNTFSPPTLASEEEEIVEVSEIELSCEASYPIEWIYEGDGWSEENENILKETSKLKQASVHNSRVNSNQFISKISNLHLYEVISGIYTCRSINYPEVFLCFNIFVPNNTKSSNSTNGLDHQSLPSRGFLLESSQTIWFSEDDLNVRLPCSVSDPKLIVTLHELYDDGSDSGIRVELPFDPRKGFYVPSKLISWKRYKCWIKDRKKSLEIFLFRESASKTPYFNVAPKETLISLKVNQTLSFKCDGYRRISIETSGDCLGSIKTKYSWAGDNHYPYKASVELTPSTENGYMEIICKTQDGNQILHTWELAKYDKNGLQLTFDSTSQSFHCCTSKYSGRRPKLSSIPCSSTIECKMRQMYYLKLQQQTESEPFESQQQQGCSSLTFNNQHHTGENSYNIHEGLLKCSLGTQKQANYFIYNKYKKSGVLIDQRRSKFNTSTLVENGLASLEESIEIIHDDDENEVYRLPLGEFYLNESQSFNCLVPNQVFATTGTSIQWLLEYSNGTVLELVSNLKQKSSNQLLVEFNDASLNSISCKAPYLHSFDWLTLEFPINIQSSKIPPAIEFRHNAVGVLDIVNHNTIILNSTHFRIQKSSNELRLELICQADYPIEWVYQNGEGTPIVKSTTYRDPSSYFGTKSESITAIITMNWIQQNTGKYICRRIHDHSQFAFYDVFILGPKLFLHPESDTNTHEISIKQSSTTAIIEENPQLSFNIPCAVTNPNAIVQLVQHDKQNSDWKIIANSSSSQRPASTTTTQFVRLADKLLNPTYIHVSTNWCPLIGFTINLTMANESELNNNPTENLYYLLKTFKCISYNTNNGLVASSSNFTIEPVQLPNLVTAVPSSNTIEINELEEDILYFECTSPTKLSIHFVNNPELESIVSIDYYMFSSENKPLYTGNFTINLSQAKQVVSNYSLIQCLEKDSSRILHYWELTNYGSDLITSFKFKQNDASTPSYYECCTNSYHSSPVISYLPCSNVIECRVQKHCLKTNDCIESHGGAQFFSQAVQHGINNKCTSMTIARDANNNGNITEGIIKCSIPGLMKPKVSKVFMFYTKLDQGTGNIYEIHTDNWNFDFNNKKETSIPTSSILQLQINQMILQNISNTAEVKKYKIDCLASKFFLSNGFIFGLESINSSMEYKSNELEIGEESSFYIASLILTNSNLETLKKIYCFAPEWKSFETNNDNGVVNSWRNISISIIK